MDLEDGALLEQPEQPEQPGRRRLHWLLGAVVLVVLVVLVAWGIPAPGATMTKGAVASTISLQLKESKCSDFPRLKFLNVTHNNLANMGPDIGKEGIAYHVRTADGKDMLMDVHALGTFKAGQPKDFGMNGAYGSVNVLGPSDARLVVSFRDFKTKAKVYMDDFTLSFFDLDMGHGGHGLEALTITGDWTVALVAEDTTVLVHHSEEDERRITFQATNKSAGADNPKDPNTLTLNQYNKAITVRFQHADEFHLTLHVKTIADMARVFEFIGVASILCAKSPIPGEILPVGEIYVNADQMKEVGAGPPVSVSADLWLVLACIFLGICLAISLIPWCFPKKEEPYRELVLAPTPQPATPPPPPPPPPPPKQDKQGPGIFSVALAGGAGSKLGLHIDFPEGLNFPPMIKKILEGSVDKFNKEGKPNAIEPHDMIVKVGDVSDPALIMSELKKGLPEEANLTLDRPFEIKTKLHGSLGVKLDALQDSYGAVITAIEPSGSIAQYNAENPKMKMNKGDRIVSVNGSTFDPKQGWTLRSSPKSPSSSAKKSTDSFGSRQKTRLLEEMEDFKDMDIEVVMLKFTTFD